MPYSVLYLEYKQRNQLTYVIWILYNLKEDRRRGEKRRDIKI